MRTRWACPVRKANSSTGPRPVRVRLARSASATPFLEDCSLDSMPVFLRRSILCRADRIVGADQIAPGGARAARRRDDRAPGKPFADGEVSWPAADVLTTTSLVFAAGCDKRGRPPRDVAVRLVGRASRRAHSSSGRTGLRTRRSSRREAVRLITAPRPAEVCDQACAESARSVTALRLDTRRPPGREAGIVLWASRAHSEGSDGGY